MKNNFFLVLVLISFSSFSQVISLPPHEIPTSKYSLEELDKEKLVQQFTNTDTLYIYIKNNKNKNVYESINHKGHPEINYTFKLKDNSSVEFNYRKYQDFDDMTLGKTSIIKKEHKSFLRKHKKEILTYNFFMKNKDKDPDYLVKMLSRIISTKRIVFMIDENKSKERMIILRQVTLNRWSHKALYLEI